jgi:DNA repair photolyase
VFSVAMRPVDNPPNRWHATHVAWDEGEAPLAALEVFEERAKSILTENDSPDIPVRWGLNPYRGCSHACAYCFARPTHQYLGFGAGTDFDRKIVVKLNAAALLREAFERPSWRGETVMLSGNTDCYQALEGRYKITRACLEVFAAYRNPVGVITKGILVRRDVDLLAELARHGAAHVYVSIPFFDDAIRRKVEPLASPVAQRFETLRVLTAAGVPCGVSVSPIIPGLNDGDVAKVIEAAHAAGARRAFMTPLRLPGETMTVYDARMAEAFPDRVKRMDSALVQVRRGKRNETAFGARMTGDGARWEIVRQLFHATCKRLGMNAPEEDGPTPFLRPWTQGKLF